MSSNRLKTKQIGDGPASASTYLNGAGSFTTPAGSGANTALSNLASVSINTALLFQTGVDLGSTTKPARDVFLFGSGTYATTYLRLTGTPTGTRVLTLPDATDTLVGLATTDTLTNKTITGLMLTAGSTTVQPIKMTVGTNLTVPVAGSIEFDGTDYFITI